MSILTLPDELLRHVASFVDDLEQGSLAAAKAGRAIVTQAHRCGVVLSLRNRPSQRGTPACPRTNTGGSCAAVQRAADQAGAGVRRIVPATRMVEVALENEKPPT